MKDQDEKTKNKREPVKIKRKFSNSVIETENDDLKIDEQNEKLNSNNNDLKIMKINNYNLECDSLSQVKNDHEIENEEKLTQSSKIPKDFKTNSINRNKPPNRNKSRLNQSMHLVDSEIDKINKESQ